MGAHHLWRLLPLDVKEGLFPVLLDATVAGGGGCPLWRWCLFHWCRPTASCTTSVGISLLVLVCCGIPIGSFCLSLLLPGLLPPLYQRCGRAVHDRNDCVSCFTFTLDCLMFGVEPMPVGPDVLGQILLFCSGPHCVAQCPPA